MDCAFMTELFFARLNYLSASAEAKGYQISCQFSSQGKALLALC